MILLHSDVQTKELAWEMNSLIQEFNFLLSAHEPHRHQTDLLRLFIENNEVWGSSSGYAASIGGDPGPKVGALFGHWACDGWTWGNRWVEFTLTPCRKTQYINGQ